MPTVNSCDNWKWTLCMISFWNCSPQQSVAPNTLHVIWIFASELTLTCKRFGIYATFVSFEALICSTCHSHILHSSQFLYQMKCVFFRIVSPTHFPLHIFIFPIHPVNIHLSCYLPYQTASCPFLSPSQVSWRQHRFHVSQYSILSQLPWLGLERETYSVQFELLTCSELHATG